MNFNQEPKTHFESPKNNNEITSFNPLKEAWTLTQKPNVKLEFWKGMIITFLLSFITIIILGTIIGILTMPFPHAMGAFMSSLCGNIVGFVICSGLIVLAIRYVKFNELNYKNIFFIYKKEYIIPLLLCGLIISGTTTLTTQIGSYVRFLGGILSMLIIFYINLIWVLATPLILEGKTSCAITALGMSQKTIQNDFLNYALIYLKTIAIGFVATVCTLGIGLIWVIPWTLNVYALIYSRAKFENITCCNCESDKIDDCTNK